MKKSSWWVLLRLFVSLAIGSEQTYAAVSSKVGIIKDCSYYDTTRNINVDGPCTSKATQIDGHIAEVISFSTTVKVTVEYINSDSGMHAVKMNGSNGLAFEIDRYHFLMGTDDLTQRLEWDAHGGVR